MSLCYAFLIACENI